MVLRAVFRLAPAGEQREREIEILVLRHELQVLKRKAGRPKLRRSDRLFLAAAASILPRSRWSSFIVTPTTLLRWHRGLRSEPRLVLLSAPSLMESQGRHLDRRNGPPKG